MSINKTFPLHNKMHLLKFCLTFGVHFKKRSFFVYSFCSVYPSVTYGEQRIEDDVTIFEEIFEVLFRGLVRCAHVVIAVAFAAVIDALRPTIKVFGYFCLVYLGQYVKALHRRFKHSPFFKPYVPFGDLVSEPLL